jgi:hypothetical protein
LLTEPETSRDTVSDRVEIAVSEILCQEFTNSTLASLDIEICRRFAGLLTPERNYVRTCLQAYGSEIPEKFGTYRLALEVQNFESELLSVENLIKEMGHKFGFTVNNKNGLAWHDSDEGHTAFRFHLLLNTCISKLVYSKIKNKSTQQIILYPDRLSDLMIYKLDHNPLLNTALSEFGKAITFSQIIRFFQNENITLMDFIQMLDDRSSPHQYPSQISIFK